MSQGTILDLFNISDDSHAATKSVVDIVIGRIWPLMLSVKNKLDIQTIPEDHTTKLKDVFTLCCSQIKKCIVQLLEIFKLEHQHNIILQESRHCLLERLSWCVNRLDTVNNSLDKDSAVTGNEDAHEVSANASILTTPMYFVNWIDHTFQLLTSLSSIIYRTDYKDSIELTDVWKNELVDCISALHISIDELLLSAMTLGNHCLPADKHIITARCQVVLREAKTLLTELVEEDLNGACKSTKQSLKVPIMPSNVNVLIDVLKDVLFVLETNTNTALLALLVHCFSNGISPVDTLRNHVKGDAMGCACGLKTDEITEDCSFIKEFDLYNERLLQIGSFAMSCSSDQNRILSVRSGLASLEALDPHLVPALMMSPNSHHARMLINSWHQEVQEIRDSVFLIVDPAAFAEKSKQMLHKILLEIIQNNKYNNQAICSIINIGSVIQDFFTVYTKYEPNALTQIEKLTSLLKDLDKAQIECKIVSNMLSDSDQDFLYHVRDCKNIKNKATLEQLIKRLKLLYTLVNRINSLFYTKDNDEQFFANNEVYEEEFDGMKTQQNLTHTVHKKNFNTFRLQNTADSKRKPINNISRSIFSRTSNMRTFEKSNILSRLTKNLKINKNEKLNFSLKLDQLFNSTHQLTDFEPNKKQNPFVNKSVYGFKEMSILYNLSPTKSKSLRKAVLSRNYTRPLEMEIITSTDKTFQKNNLMDETTNLQITEILDQFTDLSMAMSITKWSIANTSTLVSKQNQSSVDQAQPTNNVLMLNINNGNTSISKHIWNIPVNVALDNTGTTNISASSQPSNISTLERINDIDLLDNRLNDLKLHRETNL